MIGLRRLGYDVYYVEAHGRNPNMLMERPEDDATARAVECISGIMRRFDLADRWAFHALHDDGRCHGMSAGRLRELYANAALIINYHGGTEPLPEHAATGRLVYLETDPVLKLVRLAEGIYVHREALARARERMASRKGETIDVGAFKDFFGLPRKIAIPLLEWFDREGVTKRVGDARVVL